MPRTCRSSIVVPIKLQKPGKRYEPINTVLIDDGDDDDEREREREREREMWTAHCTSLIFRFDSLTHACSCYCQNLWDSLGSIEARH
jgi:hypothetical protein